MRFIVSAAWHYGEEVLPGITAKMTVSEIKQRFAECNAFFGIFKFYYGDDPAFMYFFVYTHDDFLPIGLYLYSM